MSTADQSAQVKVARTRFWEKVIAALLGAVSAITVSYFANLRYGSASPSTVSASEPKPATHLPLAERLRDAFLVSFEVGYNYPEQDPDPGERLLLGSRWDYIFFGRQPPAFWNDSEQKMVRLWPPRAVSQPATGRVSRGQAIFAVKYEPARRRFELEGDGSYSDWLDTGVGAEDAKERYIRTTWGLHIGLREEVTPDKVFDGAKIPVVFTLNGAGAETRFSGEVTLSASRWVSDEQIPLHFLGSDRLTESENQMVQQAIARIPVASVRIGTIQPLGSDSILSALEPRGR